MPVVHLWYIKRGGQQRGPYPPAVIERNIGLGRIVATDLLSSDGEQWLAATEFPDFELHRESKASGAARKLEERQHERRTALPAASVTTPEVRKLAERRRPEDPLEIQSREKSYRVWRSLDVASVAPTRIFFGIGIAVCVLGVVSWQARRAEIPNLVQCEAGAAPGVVWDFCDKQGTNLSGASLLGGSLKNTNLSSTNLTAAELSSTDLAYANLTGAKLLNADLSDANLTGAILRGADLSGADLTGANLSFADLTDAKLAATTLQQALLAQTIWRDGVVCAARSVGVCIMGGTSTLAK
jgi:Pentapeptide repeats (8 copies)